MNRTLGEAGRSGCGGPPVAYVHDHRFGVCSDGKFYSTGNFSNLVFERYAPFDATILVICRVRHAPTSEVNQISLPCVSFRPVRGAGFAQVFGKYLLINVRCLYQSIRRSRAVIIRLPSILGVVAWGASRLLRKPYFVELVGDPYESLVAARPGRMDVRLLARCLRFMVSRAVINSPGVIYVTREALQQSYPCKGFSASASNVEIEAVVEERPGRMLLRGDEVTLGIIGSYYNQYKGIDTAIRVLAVLRSKGFNCTLRILGEGDEGPLLALAARLGMVSHVFFDGRRSPGSQVNEWLDNLDIYLQPSRTEGLPRALIEAMSRGLPCVATRVGGMPELLDDLYLVKSDDIEALADRVILLVACIEERQRQSEVNRITALKYTKEVLGQVREEFWRKAAWVLSGQ